MTVNLNESPYYNDFDPNKNYTMIVAVPGRVEQAREFTQIQSSMLHHIKGIGDTVLKDGNIRQGCEIVLNENTATVHSGYVYLNGLVRKVEETTVPIRKSGEEIIGVKLVQKIVTEVEDSSLRDPAQGHANYNQPGAHRLQETVEVCANDAQSTPVYRLKDGILIRDEEKPQLDAVSDMLARRTFDEVGNYLVHGMQIVGKGSSNETEALIMVESGKAYIKGYEINKPMATPVWLPKSLDFRTVLAEPKIFNTGTNRYAINSLPVKTINRVTAVIEVTNNIVRGNIPGGVDLLPHTPVVDVVQVTQSSTTYVKGTDFQVTADGIDWSLSGKEPAIGSTYSVKWKYNKILDKGTDYVHYIDSATNREYIDFTSSAIKPVNGTTFTIDYDFYLARKDLVAVSHTGDIVVIPGTPDTMKSIATPYVTDSSLLRLGTVILPPNSSDLIVNNNAITRMTMEKMYNLVNRIEAIEYNQAISNLDKVAIDGEGATNLRGVLTDGFIDLSKADTTHPDYTASMNPFKRYQTVGFTGESVSLEQDEANPEYNAHKFSTIITAPYSEESLIEQARATEKLLINPYNVFQRTAVLSLTPGSDTDIDGVVTIIDGSNQRLDKLIQSSEFFNSDRWLQTEKQNLINQGYTDIEVVKNGNEVILTAQSATNTFKDTMIPYIRPQNIKVEATNLVKNTDNLKLTFDGVDIPLVAESAGYVGTEPNSLKADRQGVTKGSFDIPEKIRTGTREVVLYNDNNRCTTTFEAQGTRQDTDVTIKTITIVYKPKPAPPVDPVAQSFHFSQSRFITSVGLFFATKDPDENVVMEIRNVVNGYPGDLVYATKVINPDTIQVSNDGTRETKVQLDNPMFCEADTHYCIVLITNSAVPSVYVANLGDKDLATGQFVVEQPYIGVLFSSSNGLAWTAHQTKDMKFKVYGAKFNSVTGVVTFKPMTKEATMVAINTNAHVPSGTSIQWEYQMNNTGVWHPAPNLSDIYLPSKATVVQFRAKMCASTYLAPMLSLETAFVKIIMSSLTGTYLTRQVVMDDEFTSVKQIAELYIPSGTTVNMKFTTDGTTWIKGTQSSAKPVDQDYTQYTFEHTLSQPATVFRAKIEFNTSNPAVQPKARNFMNIMK